MAPRQMKMPEKVEAEPEEHFSQRKRPELGRYLLQVDRQTKGSYLTAELAEFGGTCDQEGISDPSRHRVRQR